MQIVAIELEVSRAKIQPVNKISHIEITKYIKQGFKKSNLDH